MKSYNYIKNIHYLLTGFTKQFENISSYVLKMKKRKITQLELVLTHSPRKVALSHIELIPSFILRVKLNILVTMKY